MAKISHFTQTVNGVSTTYDIHDANAIPRSGGAVMAGDRLARTVDNSLFAIYGGTGSGSGGSVAAYGKDVPTLAGTVVLQAALAYQQLANMILYPDGTWTWSGTAVQFVSDQRLKQQITEIDDKLLDAWEDVSLVQFKYNDAVDQKGKDKARLHTGYVVQQIAEACQNHDVDIDNYGLYCHEVYPERTEEVTIENEDGTTTKETKVIEPAKEHYSLRYTEALIVECAFLRREVERLTERVTKLESRKKKTTS